MRLQNQSLQCWSVGRPVRVALFLHAATAHQLDDRREIEQMDRVLQGTLGEQRAGPILATSGGGRRRGTRGRGRRAVAFPQVLHVHWPVIDELLSLYDHNWIFLHKYFVLGAKKFCLTPRLIHYYTRMLMSSIAVFMRICLTTL